MAAVAAGSKKITVTIEAHTPMTKSSFLLLVLLILLTEAFASEAAEKKKDGGDPPAGLHELTFFFSNDVWGETEPCG